MSLRENDIYNEARQEYTEEEQALIQEWYLKQWISYNQYKKMTGLPF